MEKLSYKMATQSKHLQLTRRVAILSPTEFRTAKRPPFIDMIANHFESPRSAMIAGYCLTVNTGVTFAEIGMLVQSLVLDSLPHMSNADLFRDEPHSCSRGPQLSCQFLQPIASYGP